MAKLQYESKYDVGDKLFIVEKDKKLCPMCLCYHEHYFVREAEIEHINVNYLGIQYSTRIKLSKNATRYRDLSEYEFYKNKEDAQKMCDSNNADLLKDKKRYLKYL